MSEQDKEKLRLLGIIGGLFLGTAILLVSMLSLSWQMAKDQREYRRSKIEKTEIATRKGGPGVASCICGIASLGVAIACSRSR